MRLVRLMCAVLFVAAASLPAFASDPPAGPLTPSPSPARGEGGKDSTPAVPATTAGPAKANAAKPDVAKSNAAKPTAAKTNIPKPPAPLSAEREAAALAFAREQHPELAALIDKLRHDNRRDYDRAIRQLSVDCERLTRLKKQSAEQYQLSLAAWKLDSRAQLVAARMTISQTPALEAELKQILSERADIRLKEYQAERARLEKRLNFLNTSIQALETDKNAVVEKDLLRIKRSVAARSRRPPQKPANKPSQPAIASKAPVTEPPRPPAAPTTAASVRPPDSSAASRPGDKQQ